MDKKHKIGRNDPCPCGSGKKYKKCCGAVLQTHSAMGKEVDSFKLNREIAYKGKIGQMREQFCIDYIKIKQEAIEEIEQRLVKDTTARGETITCHKGCFYCCLQHVWTSLQECEAIVYYLYQHESVLNDFIEIYPRWRAEVGEIESLFKAVAERYREVIANPLSEEKRQAFVEVGEQYLAQNIPCPFLSDGICSIYAVRPLACASVVATTPSEWCNPFNKDKPRLHIASLELATGAISFYCKIDDYILLPMPVAVYGILEGGTYYLSKIPVWRV